MQALIVSLLFLSNILDGFQALDNAGDPIPNAELTFWRSGTTAPLHVYSDASLEDQLSDSQGRVTGDSLGRFPYIYMQDANYRVLLKTERGVLRWDIDPYVCDCNDPPYLFRDPKYQALDQNEEGETLPGATLTFTLTETETPTNVYADPGLKVPLRNPLPSDAAGFFPPVYLDDTIDYRVRLADRAGNEVLDIDPYVCQCGFLLLTSRPYPYEFAESVDFAGAPTSGMSWRAVVEEMQFGGICLGGVLESVFVEYDDWPAEEIAFGGAFLGGTLETPLAEYNDWPPEEIDFGGTCLGGTLESLLITYDEWPSEEIDFSSTCLGGSLTTP